MKPVLLKFRAFGPYVEEQIIDFNELERAGLFLICGETGAGKTVILDAITYALYGKSSGAGRGDISAMRCQLAPSNISTEIEFVFEIRGKQYKFTRSIKYARKNFNTTQNALQKEGEGFASFFENPKIRDVEDKAKELLGLNYEQFRQVIILPQGQFERLLVAKSNEKEEILVSLFGADRWQKIAEYISGRINEQRRLLDIQKANIERSLADKGCENPLELSALLESKAQTLKIKEKELVDITKQLENAKKEFESQNSVFEKFCDYEKTALTLSALKQKENEISVLKERLDKTIKADSIKSVYIKYEAAEAEARLRKTQVREEEEKLSAFKAELETVKKSLDKLIALLKNNENDKIRLSRLSEMTDIYTKIDEAKKALDAAENSRAAILKSVDTQNEAVRKLSSQKLDMSRGEAEIYAEYTRMFSSFLGNISGTLAQQLQENMPCPVCGSELHPSPAKMLDTDIDNDMLEAKKAEIEDIRTKLKEKETQLQKETEKLSILKDKLNHAEVEKERLKSEYNNILQNLDSEIKDINGLNHAVTALKNKILGYETDLSAANENMLKIQKDYDTCAASLDIHSRELTGANSAFCELETELESRLAEYLFTNIEEFKESLLSEPEKAELYQRITDYKVECENTAKKIMELEGELKDKEKPDIEQLKENIKILEESNLSLVKASAVFSQEVSDLKKLLASLLKQIKKYESSDKKYRDNQVFSKQLRGDNGVSLQRYVLGVMLTSITTEANRLLENVHNGRYKLFRTLETTGGARKAGLELEVFDSLTGERRSVLSLSGGEKFLVALSLSIGLSAVVQAQSGGIRLDAMFIDEGFGSLDSASIGDALMVLSNIKNSNGIVGIISHVSVLRENISAKIEVYKNKNGSSLSVIV